MPVLVPAAFNETITLVQSSQEGVGVQARLAPYLGRGGRVDWGTDSAVTVGALKGVDEWVVVN